MAQIGQRLMREQAGVRSDLARVVQLMQQALQDSGGPFLFGEFTATDAFYVPVLSRVRTYALPIPDDVQAYSARVFATAAVSEWVSAALLEKEFVAEDELYRTSRD
jgi:glutathione S-transferase